MDGRRMSAIHRGGDRRPTRWSENGRRLRRCTVQGDQRPRATGAWFANSLSSAHDGRGGRRQHPADAEHRECLGGPRTTSLIQVCGDAVGNGLGENVSVTVYGIVRERRHGVRGGSNASLNGDAIDRRSARRPGQCAFRPVSGHHRRGERDLHGDAVQPVVERATGDGPDGEGHDQRRRRPADAERGRSSRPTEGDTSISTWTFTVTLSDRERQDGDGGLRDVGGDRRHGDRGHGLRRG